MKTTIQIKTIFGKLLFEFEKENNSIKETITEAVKRGAYLQRADLQRADLQRANALNTVLPEGELIVWKKLQNNLICKLLVPIKAKRVNCIGSRKCRFEYCKVIAIYDGKKKVNQGYGQHDSNFIYQVGDVVKPDSFDDSPLIECSHGIHAFITRLEAEEY
jgi:Family of unknown function (DUF5758)